MSTSEIKLTRLQAVAAIATTFMAIPSSLDGDKEFEHLNNEILLAVLITSGYSDTEIIEGSLYAALTALGPVA